MSFLLPSPHQPRRRKQQRRHFPLDFLPLIFSRSDPESPPFLVFQPIPSSRLRERRAAYRFAGRLHRSTSASRGGAAEKVDPATAPRLGTLSRGIQARLRRPFSPWPGNNGNTSPWPSSPGALKGVKFSGWAAFPPLGCNGLNQGSMDQLRKRFEGSPGFWTGNDLPPVLIYSLDITFRKISTTRTPLHRLATKTT